MPAEADVVEDEDFLRVLRDVAEEGAEEEEEEPEEEDDDEGRYAH